MKAALNFHNRSLYEMRLLKMQDLIILVEPKLPGCFNCGDDGHHHSECIYLRRHLFCAICGLRNITVKDCPRHGKPWRNNMALREAIRLQRKRLQIKR